MICPACGHDNIPGDDLCDACGQPLVHDSEESDLEKAICDESIYVLCEHEPLLINGSMTVREAVTLMADRRIGCLLVTEADELVGVFTERDVLNRISEDLTRLEGPVSDFMTRTPESVTKKDSIAYALHAMHLGGYRHIPVVDANRHPIGIVSIRDVMRYLCVRFAEIRA